MKRQIIGIFIPLWASVDPLALILEGRFIIYLPYFRVIFSGLFTCDSFL